MPQHLTNHGGPVAADQIERTAQALLDAAQAAGMWISGDGRIGEADLAILLGLSASRLGAKRAEGSGPKWLRLGGKGHKVSYRISDVAAWIEARRADAA